MRDSTDAIGLMGSSIVDELALNLAGHNKDARAWAATALRS